MLVTLRQRKDVHNSLVGTGVGVSVGVAHCSSLFPVRETNVNIFVCINNQQTTPPFIKGRVK